MGRERVWGLANTVEDSMGGGIWLSDLQGMGGREQRMGIFGGRGWWN